jgi:hypothetical protein
MTRWNACCRETWRQISPPESPPADMSWVTVSSHGMVDVLPAVHHLALWRPRVCLQVLISDRTLGALRAKSQKSMEQGPARQVHCSTLHFSLKHINIQFSHDSKHNAQTFHEPVHRDTQHPVGCCRVRSFQHGFRFLWILFLLLF